MKYNELLKICKELFIALMNSEHEETSNVSTSFILRKVGLDLSKRTLLKY